MLGLIEGSASRAYDEAVVCTVCERTFPSRAALARHRALPHVEAPVCPICRMRFDSPSDLKAHNEGVHGMPRS